MPEAFLPEVPLFQKLPKPYLKQLAEAAKERDFVSGETIFREGEAARHVWIVKKGWVRLVRQDSLKRPRTVFVLTPAEVFCGISALDHGVYSAEGIAATDSVLFQIPVERFDALLDHSPTFVRRLLKVCCERIRRMAEAYALSQAPVETRILHVLEHLQEDFGPILPFTHREIAEMAGTTIETSIRTLSRFKKQGLIKSSRGKVILLNHR